LTELIQPSVNNPSAIRSNLDWRLYHAIYDLSLDHHWLGDLFSGIERASIPFMVAALVLLWLAAKPGGSGKWKLAAVGALLSSGLAIVINRIISSIWFRERPFRSHRIPHPWINVHDASFPSDHASASFAIAFAVVLIDPLVGAVFVVCALLISVGRLFIGAHYPGDVVAGCLVGLLSALLVIKPGRKLVAGLGRLIERGTDPLVEPLWRLARR
jgi:undecaprenyl-diphosphatase